MIQEIDSLALKVQELEKSLANEKAINEALRKQIQEKDAKIARLEKMLRQVKEKKLDALSSGVQSMLSSRIIFIRHKVFA